VSPPPGWIRTSAGVSEFGFDHSTGDTTSASAASSSVGRCEPTNQLVSSERTTATRGEAVSPHRVAFGTDADGFLSFLDRLKTLELTNRDGDPVTAADVVDHDLSYSLYFTDSTATLARSHDDRPRCRGCRAGVIGATPA
jgi:hypothetical protein